MIIVYKFERKQTKGVGGEDGGTPEIVLCRHGATLWDSGAAYDRSQGQLNFPPLDPDGYDEAKELRDQLRDERITYIVSSDTTRAFQTAEIVAYPHGEPVYGDPSWRAWDLGELDGRPMDRAHAEAVAGLVASPATPPPAGETFAQFRGRVLRALRYLFDLIVPGDRYIVVTHSHIVRLVDLWQEQGWREDGLTEAYHRAWVERRPIIKRGGFLRFWRNGQAWTVAQRWKDRAA